MHEKQLLFARKGDGGFNWGSASTRKGDAGFRQADTLADRARLRYPWAAARPGRASSRHTSTRQHTRPHLCEGRRRDLPRCRWAAAGPGRASRQRTEQHQRPGPTGVKGAGGTGGPGCGARGRRRGLAGLRGDAPSEARGADGSRAGRRPRAQPAARPDSTPRGARNTRGAASNAGDLSGQQATPEICRGNKQHEAARPHTGPGGSRVRPLGGSQR